MASVSFLSQVYIRGLPFPIQVTPPKSASKLTKCLRGCLHQGHRAPHTQERCAPSLGQWPQCSSPRADFPQVLAVTLRLPEYVPLLLDRAVLNITGIRWDTLLYKRQDLKVWEDILQTTIKVSCFTGFPSMDVIKVFLTFHGKYSVVEGFMVMQLPASVWLI